MDDDLDILLPGLSDEVISALFGDRVPDVRPHDLRVPPEVPRFSLAAFLIFLIRAYRRSYLHAITHKSGCPCVFIPTCTDYFERAVRKYGGLKGLFMYVARLRRCDGSCIGPYVDFP